ncbi:MAG: LysM peptidoglycan-binding domain-containing protein [Anaerolineaceae bacterium]
MNQEKNSKNTKICPVCGTRLSENATRCLVCGAQLSATAEVKKGSGMPSKRLPEVKLTLPVAIGLGLVFLALVGLLIYFIVKPPEPAAAVETPEATTTLTPTQTLTPTMTLTPTPLPTWTPLPPIEYTVKSTDYCSTIAGFFGVSIQSIIRENNLDTNCTIKEGDVLRIPQPTPTPSPQPTATSEAAVATESDCQTLTIEVESGWTLYSIALNYNVEMSSIQEYNNMTNTIVYEGMPLIIPLCERKPTAGPTPTPTPAPPYPAPNLLLPSSGAAFTAENQAITLQWASVADLRENELYRVTIEDLTASNGKILVEYVTDTKFILPSSFRPIDANPHIIQWSVTVARQINQGEINPIYEEAGVVSEKRVFSWIGTGMQPTTTP